MIDPSYFTFDQVKNPIDLFLTLRFFDCLVRLPSRLNEELESYLAVEGYDEGVSVILPYLQDKNAVNSLSTILLKNAYIRTCFYGMDCLSVDVLVNFGFFFSSETSFYRGFSIRAVKKKLISLFNRSSCTSEVSFKTLPPDTKLFTKDSLNSPLPLLLDTRLNEDICYQIKEVGVFKNPADEKYVNETCLHFSFRPKVYFSSLSAFKVPFDQLLCWRCLSHQTAYRDGFKPVTEDLFFCTLAILEESIRQQKDPTSLPICLWGFYKPFLKKISLNHFWYFLLYCQQFGLKMKSSRLFKIIAFKNESKNAKINTKIVEDVEFLKNSTIFSQSFIEDIPEDIYANYPFFENISEYSLSIPDIYLNEIYKTSLLKVL